MTDISNIGVALLLYGFFIFGGRKYSNMSFWSCVFTTLMSTGIFWLLSAINIENTVVTVIGVLVTPIVASAIVGGIQGWIEGSRGQ